MNRTPPVAVRRLLRSEVGFGCPIPGCGNPYLRWHHFDPPWRVLEHHNPEGMIALCGEHHDKADSGAFTIEQLRSFKRRSEADVRGRFDWMRNDLLAVIGGSFFYKCPVPLTVRSRPCIWFSRDEGGLLLLNFDMAIFRDEPRLRLEDNFWILPPGALDLECPPSGRLIEARYANGDRLRVEFFEISAADAFLEIYPTVSRDRADSLSFPITAVEIHLSVGGVPYVGPTEILVPVEFSVTNCLFVGGGGVRLFSPENR
jgi:hypothetical protein